MTYLDDRLIEEMGYEVDLVIETEDDYDVVPMKDEDIDAFEKLLRTWS